MNYFLKKFYNTVKDSSWPDIKNYIDFKNLPEHIQNECIVNHNLLDTLDTVESTDHWRNLAMRGIYKKNNLVFISMYKCGGSTYIRYLENQNWEKISYDEIDFDNMYVFGFILDPMQRRLKGITQVLFDFYHHDIDKIIDLLESDSDFKQIFLSISMMDKHTTPYWLLFGNDLEKINWIPLDCYSKEQVNDLFSKICKNNNVQLDEDIEPITRHRSCTCKLKLFNSVEKIFGKQNISDLWLLYANDMKFYRKLLDSHLSNKEDD